MIKARCENADKGCKVVVNYLDLKRHASVCDYAIVKCTNYGCEKEMFQNYFVEHQNSCEFRTIRCEKCDVIIEKD